MKHPCFSFWRVLGYGIAYAVLVLLFMLMFVRHPQFSSAHPLFCGVTTVALPTLCLFLCCVFLQQNHRGGRAVRFKTRMQITMERALHYKRAQEIKRGVQDCRLPASEYSCKIKFPVVGFRNETCMVLFGHEEMSSLLSVEEVPLWTFFDSNARLVQAGVVPPLTGWRKRIRRNFFGRWLIDVPENGWIWFHLKHPVECHRVEMTEHLVQCLSQSGSAPETRKLDKLIDLLK